MVADTDHHLDHTADKPAQYTPFHQYDDHRDKQRADTRAVAEPDPSAETGAIELDKGKCRPVTPNTDWADIWLDNIQYSTRYLLTPLQGRIAAWNEDSQPTSTRCEEVLDSVSTETTESTPDTTVCIETSSDYIALLRVLEQCNNGVLLDVKVVTTVPIRSSRPPTRRRTQQGLYQ